LFEVNRTIVRDGATDGQNHMYSRQKSSTRPRPLPY